MIDKYLKYVKELVSENDRAYPLPFKLWCMTSSTEELRLSTYKMMHKVIDYHLSSRNVVALSGTEYYGQYIINRPNEKIEKAKVKAIEKLKLTTEQLEIIKEFETVAMCFNKNGIEEAFNIGALNNYLVRAYIK